MFGFGAGVGSGVITAPVLVTALASTAVLVSSVNGSMAAVTATITNPSNKFGVKPAMVLVEAEANGPASCWSDSGPGNSYSCTTIDVFNNKTDFDSANSPFVAKTLMFTLDSPRPLTTFSLSLGPCNAVAGARVLSD